MSEIRTFETYLSFLRRLNFGRLVILVHVLKFLCNFVHSYVTDDRL